MGKLENKVAIITGGVSGIGAASAKLFAEEGAKLALADINEEKGAEFVQELKDQGYSDVIFQKTDVANTEEMDELFRKTKEEFGSIDIVFNNAGVGGPDPSESVSYDKFKWTVDIDLNAVFYGSQLGIQEFLAEDKEGVIVNTASMYGTVGAPTSAAYTAAKGGVVNLGRTLGTEFASRKIRVNTLAPGFVETPILAETDREGLKATTPMNRLGTPEEMAKAALFLASDDSSFMTGQTLVVDGGYTAQ